MSWDILFMDLPKDMIAFGKFPKGFVQGNLCSRDYYNKMVQELFPDADLSNLSWIPIEGDGYSVQLNSGTGEYVESLMLHVRGNENSLAIIKRIVDYTNWKAIDTTQGEFLNFSTNQNDISDNNQTKTVKKKWWKFWK